MRILGLVFGLCANLWLLVHGNHVSLHSMSPVLLSTAASSRRLGDSLAKLCVLFNFPSGSGDELNLLGDDALLVNAKVPSDLYHICGFDAAVGYIKATDILTDERESSLLMKLVSLLEGIASKAQINDDHKLKLVFYIDGAKYGKDSSEYLSWDRKLNALVDEAVQFVFPNLVANTKVDVFVELSMDIITNIISDAKARRTGTQIASSIETVASSTRRDHPSPPSIEGRAAAACMKMMDNLIAEMKSSITSLGNKASAVDISTTVKSIVDRFNEENKDNINAFARTGAFRSAAYRGRTQLAHLLQPSYRRILDLLVAESFAKFENLARKVAPDSTLSSTLAKRAKLVMESAKESSAELQSNFLDMITKQYEGLFASSDQLSRAHWNTAFSSTLEMRKLQSDLAERCADRVRSLFLQGAYNPYIRDFPWAPTHININYLIDPRAVALGLEYNKLYDEQVEGIVNRAEPLLIKGVAKVAFDPNDHPVPKENKSWWKILLEYYKD